MEDHPCLTTTPHEEQAIAKGQIPIGPCDSANLDAEDHYMGAPDYAGAGDPGVWLSADQAYLAGKRENAAALEMATKQLRDAMARHDRCHSATWLMVIALALIAIAGWCR